MSVTFVLFQLRIIFFTFKLRVILDTTNLMSWLASPTACSRKLNRDLCCLVEQWEPYVLANHSKFPAISDEEILSETRVLAALNKVESSYLKRKFRREAHRFPCALHRSCSVQYRTRNELFLPCNYRWRGRPPAASSIWSFVGWAFEKGGSKAARLSLVGLSTSYLTKSNDRWTGVQRGAALT